MNTTHQYNGLNISQVGNNIRVSLYDKSLVQTYKEQCTNIKEIDEKESYLILLLIKYENGLSNQRKTINRIYLPYSKDPLYSTDFEISELGRYSVEASFYVHGKCGPWIKVYYPKFINIQSIEDVSSNETDTKLKIYEYNGIFNLNSWRTSIINLPSPNDTFYKIEKGVEYNLLDSSKFLYGKDSVNTIDISANYIGNNIMEFTIKDINKKIKNTYESLYYYKLNKNITEKNPNPSSRTPETYNPVTYLLVKTNTGGNYSNITHSPIYIVYDKNISDYTFRIKYENTPENKTYQNFITSIELMMYDDLNIDNLNYNAENPSNYTFTNDIYSIKFTIFSKNYKSDENEDADSSDNQEIDVLPPDIPINETDDTSPQTVILKNEPLPNNLYFKYTSGESFSLNGADYFGFFHENNGKIYTEKKNTEYSRELTPKNRFLTEIFKQRYEFDLSESNRQLIKRYDVNYFDIFNKNEFKKILDTLNHNNILAYKSLITSFPTIYNENESNIRFYGLSSKNEEILLPKNTKMHIEDFSISEKWRFLNRTDSNIVFLDSKNNFKHFLSTKDELYVLSGNFVENKSLDIINYINFYPDNDSTPDKIHNIHLDYDNKNVIVVYNDFINIYDISNFEECDKMVLLDRIKLEKTTTTKNTWSKQTSKWLETDSKFKQRSYTTLNNNNPEYIKFSDNYRTYLKQGELYLLNKYSSDLFIKIPLSNFGITQVIDIDIRKEDDLLIILHKNSENHYICVIDPHTNIGNNKVIYKLQKDKPKYSIEFSKLDSNLFYIVNEDQFHSRYISYPDYPCGKLELCDLYIPDRFIWGRVNEKHDNFEYKWTSPLYKSNQFKNINHCNFIKNGKMYTILINKGRFYTLSQDIKHQFISLVPTTLNKYFSGIKCSESSMGLYFNSFINNIINDSLNIYNKSKGFLSINEDQLIINSFQDIDFLLEDLYLNINESINTISIQRILETINNIQETIYPKILTSVEKTQ